MQRLTLNTPTESILTFALRMHQFSAYLMNGTNGMRNGASGGRQIGDFIRISFH